MARAAALPGGIPLLMTVKMRTPSTLGFAAALASAVVPHAYAARTPDSPPPLAPASGYTPGAPDELEPWTSTAATT